VAEEAVSEVASVAGMGGGGDGAGDGASEDEDDEEEEEEDREPTSLTSSPLSLICDEEDVEEATTRVRLDVVS